MDAREAEGSTAKTSPLMQGAGYELDRAESVIDFDTHRRGPSGSHVTAAQLHFNTARSLWLHSLSPTELQPYLPGMLSLVREHLAPGDQRRAAVERIAQYVDRGKGKGGRDEWANVDLVRLIEAVDAAQEVELLEKLRASSFVRILYWMIASLFLMAGFVAVLTWFREEAVPLCFNPQLPINKIEKGQQITQFSVVCPTRTASVVPENQLAEISKKNTTREDYIVVEVVGLLAASFTAASVLRKIRGTSTAYPIPVALALLKLPTGALTAVLGLLLMRGGFVPGLSALDSSAQIIAWAAVFGLSQELITKFVDKRGQAVLEAVHGPAEPVPPHPQPSSSS
jgi:hypothetical protein